MIDIPQLMRCCNLHLSLYFTFFLVPRVYKKEKGDCHQIQE